MAETTTVRTCELVLKKGDGAFFDARLESVAVDSHGDMVIRAVLTDITGHKKAEEDLRTSRLQLADAADMARIAYWECDETTDEFIFNDAFYDLFATTAEHEGGYRMAKGKYLATFVHPDDHEQLKRRGQGAQSPRQVEDIRQYEHRCIRRDGKVIHVLLRSRTM